MLTDTAIRNAKPREKPYKISDSQGLYLLVNPRGSKLWRVKYRINGVERKLAIGPYPEITLAEAGAARDAARRQIAHAIDPDYPRPLIASLHRVALGGHRKSHRAGARDAVTSFADKVPGGRSKAEVWPSNADFSQRMESFARNAEAMAKAGETGNVTAVTELMIEVMPCKECHDLHREPKKLWRTMIRKRRSPCLN